MDENLVGQANMDTQLSRGGEPNQQTQHVCPNCGYCPCCGRKSPAVPYYPPWPGGAQPYIGDWPTWPTYPTPQVTWTCVAGNIC